MVLSPDDVLIRPDGTYDWSPRRVTSAWRETLGRVASLLPGYRFDSLTLLCGVPGAGKSSWLLSHQVPSVLYVDATFTTPASRAPLVTMSTSFEKPVDCVFLDTPFEECIRRNALRPPDRVIPHEKMLRFRHDLISDPPTPREGFRQVIVVPMSP